MISTIITKSNSINKVVDLRDKLILSKTEDYAQMHGIGGKDHNPNSTIQCMICDYSGSGNSKSVSANISVDKVYYIAEQIKKIVFKQDESDKLSITAKEKSDLGVAYKTLINAIREGKNANAVSLDAVHKAAQILVSVGKGITSPIEGYDFTYSQDKVDVYSKKDGKAPVNKLLITHQPMYKGKKSNYPWCIKITNGVADIIEKEGGTVNYNAKTLNVTNEAFINVSNEDMYRMFTRTIRYIETWENAVVLPNVINGLKQREEERREYNNNHS